jgi:hypothetical protein
MSNYRIVQKLDRFFIQKLHEGWFKSEWQNLGYNRGNYRYPIFFTEYHDSLEEAKERVLRMQSRESYKDQFNDASEQIVG